MYTEVHVIQLTRDTITKYSHTIIITIGRPKLSAIMSMLTIDSVILSVSLSLGFFFLTSRNQDSRQSRLRPKSHTINDVIIRDLDPR